MTARGEYSKGALKSFGFDTAGAEPQQRFSAWSEFLAGIGGKTTGDILQGQFGASFDGLTASWGFALARMRLSAQQVSLPAKTLSGGVWLARIVDGAGRLHTERGSLAFAEGDLLVGKMPRQVRVAVSGSAALQCAYFPAIHNGSRLASLPLPPVAMALSRHQGATAFLADLVGLAASRIGSLGAEEIRPLEITLVEFLMAAVAATGASEAIIEGSKVKNATVLRATQAIELRLSDPELSPALVADHVGISLRYLQKLFEDSGENANQYIRRRRLERSFQDLSDPLYADLSIAEISYRWGFNDSAYFSRTFRERYGLSPSQHRETGRRPVPGVTSLQGRANGVGRPALHIAR